MVANEKSATATAGASTKPPGVQSGGSHVWPASRYATEDGTIKDAFGTRKVRKGDPIYDEQPLPPTTGTNVVTPNRSGDGCYDNEDLHVDSFYVESEMYYLTKRQHSCPAGPDLGYGLRDGINVVQYVTYGAGVTLNGCFSYWWYNTDTGYWVAAAGTTSDHCQ